MMHADYLLGYFMRSKLQEKPVIHQSQGKLFGKKKYWKINNKEDLHQLVLIHSTALIFFFILRGSISVLCIYVQHLS